VVKPGSQGDATERDEEPCVLVEFDLRGPSPDAMFSRLGSATERYGMWMYRHEPETRTDELRVTVAVPRAQSQREAEAVVASLLQRVKSAGASPPA
jgi:hypothetical protein